MFSNRQKRTKEDAGFQWLPGKTNHHFSVAPGTCLYTVFQSSAGNDEIDTNFFQQRAANLWKSNLHITAEAFTNMVL